MTDKKLYTAWVVLFIICAVLGFIQPEEGPAQNVLTVLSVFFFLPPAILLWRSRKEDPKGNRKLIRNLSLLSLGLTLAVLVISVVTFAAPEALGFFLHGVLGVVSTPMLCSGNWALSLFCWACLLMVSLKK